MSSPAESNSNVLYARHFPRGFGEREMLQYFSQFGRVMNVRVVRSRKTGRSKNVAYVRFQFGDVAKIAAEAMDNYLMFGKLMRCGLVPLDKNNVRKLFPLKRIQTTIEKHKANINKDKSSKGERKCRLRKMAMMKKCHQVLSQAGISFEPVVINANKLKQQAKGDSLPKKDRATVVKKSKVVKPRELIKRSVDSVTSDSASDAAKKKKKVGLKIRTISASKSVPDSSRKKRRVK